MNNSNDHQWAPFMDLWQQLFSDSVGIFSFLVIAFTLIMGAYFVWYFIRHMVNDEKNKDKG
jgi:hypothetical protein